MGTETHWPHVAHEGFCAALNAFWEFSNN